MRILETLAKPDAQAALRASLGMMEGVMADKAPTGGEEQVGIRLMQMGNHIESSTINFDENGGGKARLVEKLYPM
jgi:hypothetical protein